MKTQRRPRRSSEEIRARLIAAAYELFGENGYDATTTREICARAGVAQQQLFHNFGSKEGIFDAAFVPALSALIDRYIAEWDSARGSSTLEQRYSLLINGLFDLASDNRSILLAAISRSGDPLATPSDLLDHIARTVRKMEVVEDVPAGIDLPAAIVNTVGTIFGVVLLRDMLFPAGSPPISRDRLTAEMTATLLYGAANPRVTAHRNEG